RRDPRKGPQVVEQRPLVRLGLFQVDVVAGIRDDDAPRVRHALLHDLRDRDVPWIERSGDQERGATDGRQALAEPRLRALTQAAKGPGQAAWIVAKPALAKRGALVERERALRVEDRLRSPMLGEPLDPARLDLRGECLVGP